MSRLERFITYGFPFPGLTSNGSFPESDPQTNYGDIPRKGSRISWHTSIKYVDISKSLCVQDKLANNSAEMYKLASFPGRAQLSVACSTVKRGEPGIFSHVSIT